MAGKAPRFEVLCYTANRSALWKIGLWKKSGSLIGKVVEKVWTWEAVVMGSQGKLTLYCGSIT